MPGVPRILSRYELTPRDLRGRNTNAAVPADTNIPGMYVCKGRDGELSTRSLRLYQNARDVLREIEPV